MEQFGEQLTEMGMEELKDLIRDARTLLNEREREQRERWRSERIESLGEGGAWLEHQLVNCGNCRRCQAKPGGYHHGPYWYLYRYTDGKMKSIYAGRKLKEEIAVEAGHEEIAGLTPEEVYPEEYEGR